MDICFHLSGLWHYRDAVAGHSLAMAVSFLLMLAVSILVEKYCRGWAAKPKKTQA